MSLTEDLEFQNRLLPGVSRTFALTIPQLPDGLQDVVANAYLLCRITDTIEDTCGIEVEVKERLHERFIAAVKGSEEIAPLTSDLVEVLNNHPHEAERELVAGLDKVLRITFSFSERQRRAVERCIEIMGQGMAEFERNCSRNGLEDIPALDRYCYVVAGVVGEMLCELFCDYSQAIDDNRGQLEALAVSFGEGLQMTNILKDIYDDWERGVCWLPADVFSQNGIAPGELDRHRLSDGYAESILFLVDKAAGHLADALEYTLLIPATEKGIRRFCLWAIAMAVLTLRNIHKTPSYANGEEVKISRNSVRSVILISNLLTGHDGMLRFAFRQLVRPMRRMKS